MHIRHRLVLAAAAAILFSSAAGAATLVQVPDVPGSAPGSTTIIGLSNGGLADGSYVGATDGSLHGFFGKLGGPYATLDAGANGTQMRAINNSGWMIGFSSADACSAAFSCVEFEAAPDGTVTPITVGGQQAYGIAQGITSKGVFVGSYHPATATLPNQTTGYYGYMGQWTADLTLPFPTFQTKARGINDKSQAVGFFELTPGDIAQGFLLANGNITVINYPDPSETGTFLEGINDQGAISGSWTDALGNYHSFVLSPDHSTFTDIAVPGATDVQAFDINNLGEVTVTTDTVSYIYCSNDGDPRCKGASAGAALAQVRPAFTGSVRNVLCNGGCRFENGAPIASSNRSRHLVRSNAQVLHLGHVLAP